MDETRWGHRNFVTPTENKKRMVQLVETLEEFRRLKARKETYTIFDFTAPWCNPCQKIGPVFEALADEHTEADKLEFYKVDVDKNPDATQESRIAKMPTFQVYHGGVLVYVIEGASENNLKRMVDLTKQRVQGVQFSAHT